jgi:hypothetical protein
LQGVTMKSGRGGNLAARFSSIRQVSGPVFQGGGIEHNASYIVH